MPRLYLAIHVIGAQESQIDQLQLNCSVIAATLQRLKVGNCAAKPLPRASKNLQRLHSAFAARCNLNEAAVWLLKGC